MTTRRVRAPIFYPESDGKPMAETPVHRNEMMRIIQTLSDAFAGRADVYVSGNMMFYYEEGNPRASISPDVFVTIGVPKLPERRVYKLWEEAAPDTVFEITSPSTRREDLVKKRDLYARIGVREYVLYDPLGEYLRPPLHGFRLADGVYQPIEPDETGALLSETLRMRLRLAGGRLRLVDLVTGEDLLSPDERLPVASARAERARVEAEMERARAETERARAETERVRRAEEERRADTEAARADAAERRIAELQRLLREQDAP